MMIIGHWWNDTDKGKPKYSYRNPSQCYFVHHKYSTDRPRRERGRPQGRPSIDRLNVSPYKLEFSLNKISN